MVTSAKQNENFVHEQKTLDDKFNFEGCSKKLDHAVIDVHGNFDKDEKIVYLLKKDVVCAECSGYGQKDGRPYCKNKKMGSYRRID
jgi:hypothetical protein